MFLFWFWQMLLPMILGNLVLSADVIAMLPLGLQLMLSVFLLVYKDPITNKSGVIYRYKCSEDGCEEEYFGESARTFAERFKEHQKFPSPIHDHCNISDHKVTISNFTIIGREDQNLTRAIKEALFIMVNDPSLNRNIGKYHLPHMWDEVLHKTSDLKLKH